MVHHTGEVVFPVLMKLRTTCKVNIQYFPFDRQICGLKFASWIYDISLIHYKLENTSDPHYSESIRNSGWTILDVKQGLIWRYVNFNRSSRKFVQLVSKCISETFGFCHSIEGGFLLRHTNFGPISSFTS